MIKQFDLRDLQKNIAIGFKLPLEPDNNTFFSLTYTTFEQDKSNLINLLLTERGERKMNPDFGCDFRKKYLFGNTNNTEEITNHILDRCSTYVPNIIIDNVNVTQNEHNINIIIKCYSIYDNSLTDTIGVTIA